MNEKKIFDDLNLKENLKFWRAAHMYKCVCSHFEDDKEEMVVKKKRIVMMQKDENLKLLGEEYKN